MNRKLNVLPENPDKGAKGRFPRWLHRSMPEGPALAETTSIVRKHRLHTVCEEAKCPNRLECYSKHTATFLVLGKECTRACGFCEIDFSKTPKAPDPEEPENVAESIEALGLKHVVITMVARDDLPDGGAEALVQIMRASRKRNPEITLELLTSDFAGNLEALDTVLAERPEIFNHNLETVRRLSPRVRHKATYERTLSILSHVKQSAKTRFVKSGIMVGLGETDLEVEESLRDLANAGCDIITIGHYLQPSRFKLPVKSFITPEQFDHYAEYGKSLGIKHIYSGPFVRSSYNAEQVFSLAGK